MQMFHVQAERAREIGEAGGCELDEKTRIFFNPPSQIKDAETLDDVAGRKDNAKRFEEKKRSGTNIKRVSKSIKCQC